MERTGVMTDVMRGTGGHPPWLADYEALRNDFGARRGRCSLIDACGPDAEGFLQGQLSADVSALEVGGSARTLLLHPDGKLHSVLRVHRVGEQRYWLVAPAEGGRRALERLERFKLRTDCEMRLDEVETLTVLGPQAPPPPPGAQGAPAPPAENEEAPGAPAPVGTSTPTTATAPTKPTAPAEDRRAPAENGGAQGAPAQPGEDGGAQGAPAQPGEDGGPQGAPAAVCAGLRWGGVPGWEMIGEVRGHGQALRECAAEAFEALRVELGVPADGEFQEGMIPAESGVVAETVSFTKGCFVGQELVARIDSRGGNVPRHLRGVLITGGGPGADDTHGPGANAATDPGAETGTETGAGAGMGTGRGTGAAPPVGAALVLADGSKVGELTSVSYSPALGRTAALAYVRRKVVPPALVEVRWDGGSAQAEIRTLPLAP